jgi:hypothetical protein
LRANPLQRRNAPRRSRQDGWLRYLYTLILLLAALPLLSILIESMGTHGSGDAGSADWQVIRILGRGRAVIAGRHTAGGAAGVFRSGDFRRARPGRLESRAGTGQR